MFEEDADVWDSFWVGRSKGEVGRPWKRMLPCIQRCGCEMLDADSNVF